MSSEIKIGDTVDCNAARFNASCVGGKVYGLEDEFGELWIKGKWSDGSHAHSVRPDQITRHVPASPVAEKPRSVGDKLASEMTVREIFAMFALKGMLANPNAWEEKDSNLAGYSILAASALIAALDKERTP